MTWTYKLIKTLFKMTSGAFYATIELRGEENIPKPGEACILCFNHGNGLADPKLIIRATPRMVRFCAKDTLWKIPIMGTFIANSGAVPVYRRRDHKGKNTKELNAIMFKNVYDALGRGEMIGIAPEGVSRFLPFMAEPLKTGPARMALAAVELHMEKDEGCRNPFPGSSRRYTKTLRTNCGVDLSRRPLFLSVGLQRHKWKF